MADAPLDATTDNRPPRNDWREAGRGWGARAKEWAYLFEPYARPANDLVLDELAVGDGTNYLDIACGSGLAANIAARRGASVSGVDAAAALIDIAQARTPEGDFRVGDMFALPFADDSFGVVTSFNGIWNECEDALREVRRVLAPDGKVGMTFWGSFDRMGLLPYFLAIIEHSPPSHQVATASIGDTAGVAELMLSSTGFDLRPRVRSRSSTSGPMSTQPSARSQQPDQPSRQSNRSATTTSATCSATSSPRSTMCAPVCASPPNSDG